MKTTLGLVCGLLFLLGALARAADLDPALQSKVDEQLKLVQALAAEPALVAGVKAQNASLPPDLAAMTQDKWKAASLLDPVLRGLSKNAVAEVLKSKRGPAFSEVFVNDANGLKVSFLSKTTNWSHKGKPKHDLPMAGKVWQGEIEVDASTGLQQLQVAVPVLDGGKPIGSVVVGLALSKLK